MNLSFSKLPKKIYLVYSQIKGDTFKEKLVSIQKKYKFNSQTTIQYMLESIDNDKEVSPQDILAEIAEKKLNSKCHSFNCNFKCWE